MTDKIALTPSDWTLAAIAALAAGGIEAVRVERLARTLKTSKGSFYWHFADRAALLRAMLDLWEAEGTADVIARLAAISEPAERLREVAREALVATTRGIDVSRAEGALRSWAAQDQAVAARLQAVEGARVAFLEAELKRLGYDGQQAGLLGKAIYLALLGLYSARRYDIALADNNAVMALIDAIIDAAPRLG